MDHGEVVKRAWQTAWGFRALWIFGIVLALVTFSWETATIFDPDNWDGEPGITITRTADETFAEALRRTVRQEVDEANRELSAFLSEDLGMNRTIDVRTITAVLLAITILIYVLGKIARYVSETALIRMVGWYQENGERMSVCQGLRLGWSRRAWGLFGIDLLIGALALTIGILLFGAILAPLPLWVDSSEGVIFTFAFLTGGFLLAAIAVAIIGGTIVVVWQRLARQACALDGLGVTKAIGRGWRVTWRHLKDTGLTWLISFGVRLIWSAVTIPLVILLVGVGLLISGLPGVAAGGLVGLATTGDVPVFVGLALGLSIFLLVLIAPLAFVGGLREVFVSSLWTLTYRNLWCLEGLEPNCVVAVDPSALEAASAT